MRSVLFAVAIAGSLGAGCKDDTPDFPVDAGFKDAPTDAPPPPWWKPKPGTANNFDVQLSAPFDVSLGRTMYNLNLWDLVPASTVLDYGDGSPITVPAGALATRMAELHARRPRTVVICDIGTGGISLTDPDASKFPGFEAAPPDDPTEPEPNSVIGWSVLAADGVTPIPNLRYLDIRPDARPTVMPLIEKRFDLAKQIGCDGIVGRHNFQFANTGFTTPASPDVFASISTWMIELVAPGHMRELSMGLRDGWNFAGIADQMTGTYDWVLAVGCGADPDKTCRDFSSPFTDVEKASLALDYGTVTGSDLLCIEQMAAVKDGIIKNAELSSAVRRDCFATTAVTP